VNVLVAIYADLELYPPSLNAVRELAARVDHVYVVLRSLGHDGVDLPANVTVTCAIRTESEAAMRAMTRLEKVQDFIRFVRCLRAVQSRACPCLVLAYDPLPLLAVRLAGVGRWSCLLWYHNHDKEARNPNRFLSLGWWAFATEASAFRRIDFFTVPARERLPLFNTQRLRTAPVLLPNYPSMQQVGTIHPASIDDVVRLVYQGSLGRHHGFQEIIPWLGHRVCGKKLHLTLVGKIAPAFQMELLALAQSSGVTEYFEIKNFVPHAELPGVLSQFHIGLAIHKPVGVTYSTGGTASNKIYEYAAVGLPVVLFDSAHYRDHLGTRYWVAFCTLTWEMFSAALETLLVDLEGRSRAAMADIEESLNFESVFLDAWKKVGSLLEKDGQYVS